MKEPVSAVQQEIWYSWGRTRKEEEGGPWEAEAGISFSQSEIPTPGPVTKKTLLSCNFKSWFGRSILRDDETGKPHSYYHGSATFGIDNSAPWTFDDSKLGKNRFT